MDVYFLVLPDVHLLDMSGPVQAIHESNELHGDFFNLHFVAPDGTISSWQGPTLSGLSTLPDRVAPGSLVFVCGMKLTEGSIKAVHDNGVVNWLVSTRTAGARIIGICTGSFVLGAAGLLDNRQCTTHHRLLTELQAAFPLARVTRERIFVDEGEVLTSAGVTAGIDLTLYLISHLRGVREALDTARELVVQNRRMGDDPQISDCFRNRNHVSPLIHEVQDHMARTYREPITVSRLAEQHRISTRHLQRLFRASTGKSIKAYLTDLRLSHARELLSTTSQSIELVAERAGFHSTRAFRDAWYRRYGYPPSHLRQGTSVRELPA